MPETREQVPTVQAVEVRFEHSYPHRAVTRRWAIECPHCGSKHLHSPVSGLAVSHCDDAAKRSGYVIEAPEGSE